VAKFPHNRKVASGTRIATGVTLAGIGEIGKVASGLVIGVGQATKPALDRGVELAKPVIGSIVSWVGRHVEAAKEKAEEAEQSRAIERRANGEESR
jgi:hypothetical protein